jgi:excisionase family DNA binding protein
MARRTFTTYRISQLCDVDVTTVINWIDDGKLRGYRTPGGHRRVRREDLLSFLRTYHLPIPEELQGRECPRILIVDDEPDTRLAIEALLRAEECYEVATAGNGFEAGVKATQWRPDLILLDMMMPDMDGFEACQILKSNPATRHIAIVALTVLSAPDDVARIRAAGVDDYLAKPFDNDELLARIKKLLAAPPRWGGGVRSLQRNESSSSGKHFRSRTMPRCFPCPLFPSEGRGRISEYLSYRRGSECAPSWGGYGDFETIMRN